MARKNNELSKATTTTARKTVSGVVTTAHTTTGYDGRNNLRTVRTVDATRDDKTRVTMHEVTIKLLVAMDDNLAGDYKVSKADSNAALLHALQARPIEETFANVHEPGCITGVYIADAEAKLNSADANVFARQAVAQTVLAPESAGDYYHLITCAAAPQRAAAVGGLSDSLAALIASDNRDKQAAIAGLSLSEREALAAVLLDC